MQNGDINIDLEVTEPGRLVEIHRNVTVEIVEHANGSLSVGWKRQENTESEYLFYDEEMT